jgi:hypothetical protein
MRPVGLVSLVRRLERLVNRPILAIIAAASIVGLAVLMSIYHPSGWDQWAGAIVAVGLMLAGARSGSLWRGQSPLGPRLTMPQLDFRTLTAHGADRGSREATDLELEPVSEAPLVPPTAARATTLAPRQRGLVALTAPSRPRGVTGYWAGRLESQPASPRQ